MPSSLKRTLSYLLISVVVIVLDQISKWYFVESFELYETVVLIPEWFNFTRLHNYGAAFSFLSDAGGWQRWFFFGLAISVSAYLIYWLYTLNADQKVLSLALVMVVGGAIGNAIDRITHGYVVDFIDVSLPFIPMNIFNPWPAFNIADSAIFIGAVLLIIDALFFAEKADSTAS